MREKELVMSGFLFSTNKEYNEAKEEQEAIEYLKANSDLSNSKVVLKLYNKLNENRTFHTPVGYTFLKELQDIVLKATIVKPEDIDEIYVLAQSNSESEELNALSLNHFKQIAEKEHTQNRNSRIINIFLVFVIIAMLGISIYSDRTVYSDFENKVIDKYASWEEELNNKEQLLNELETKLKNEDLQTE